MPQWGITFSKVALARLCAGLSQESELVVMLFVAAGLWLQAYRFSVCSALALNDRPSELHDAHGSVFKAAL